MTHHIDVEGSLCTLRLTGTCPIGSAQNAGISLVMKQLEYAHDQTHFTDLILDFTELDYTFGDAIASLWMCMLQSGVRCVVKATGGTRERLEGLMAMGVPVRFLQ